MKKNKQRNTVAKYAAKFTKAATHKDRKKRLKKGYRKHKMGYYLKKFIGQFIYDTCYYCDKIDNCSFKY